MKPLSIVITQIRPRLNCSHLRSFTILHKYKIKKGFTLVELLVVIGIMGILLSMMIPALSRAKSHARLRACQGQQRNLYKNFFLAVEDHTLLKKRESGIDTVFIRYNFLKKNYFGSYHTDSFLGDPYRRYEMLNCPSVNEEERSPYLRFWEFSGEASIGVDSYFISINSLGLLSTRRMPEQDRIKLIYEPTTPLDQIGKRWKTYVKNGDREPRYCSPEIVLSGGAHEDFGRGGNCTYQDGHTEWIKGDIPFRN